jgi:hypothetical protein
VQQPLPAEKKSLDIPTGKRCLTLISERPAWTRSAHGPRRRLETCSLLLTVILDQDEPGGRYMQTMKADPRRVYIRQLTFY